MKREVKYQIRLTKIEMARLRSMAGEADVADYVREVLFGEKEVGSTGVVEQKEVCTKVVDVRQALQAQMDAISQSYKDTPVEAPRLVRQCYGCKLRKEGVEMRHSDEGDSHLCPECWEKYQRQHSYNQ